MSKKKTLRDSLTLDQKLQLVIDNMVCSDCGGKLEIAEIEGMPQILCRPCSKLCRAVRPEVYALAKEYVQFHHWEYYTYKIIDDDVLREKANIGHFCSIINWLQRKLDLTGGGE